MYNYYDLIPLAFMLPKRCTGPSLESLVSKSPKGFGEIHPDVSAEAPCEASVDPNSPTSGS
jgi:hypothetical protein